MTAYLRGLDHRINRKRVQRLMRTLGFMGLAYANVPELLMGLTEYFTFYNAERSHQSLGYRTPDEAYRTTVGGGARIVDKFSSEDVPPKAITAIESGQRRSEPLPS